MSNNLTDILVQRFKKSFELTPLEAQLVQTSVFFCYFCMAMPAAFLMRRFGYKAGILAGLLLFGVGMLLFWPAAVIGHYGPFLLGCCGSATLETAANPFMAQFGHPSRSARRLNFGGACERAAHYVEGALQELGRGESSSEGPCKPAVWMVEGRVTGGVSAD